MAHSDRASVKSYDMTQSDQREWISNNLANSMPNISATRIVLRATVILRRNSGVERRQWAKTAAAGVASYVVGLATGSGDGGRGGGCN